MNHPKRRWCVWPERSPMDLARKLTRLSWPLGVGFELGQYVFLNDSAPEDRASEFAVLKRLKNGRFIQVESLSLGWFTYEVTLDYVKAALAGEMDRSFSGQVLDLELEAPPVPSESAFLQK